MHTSGCALLPIVSSSAAWVAKQPFVSKRSTDDTVGMHPCFSRACTLSICGTNGNLQIFIFVNFFIKIHLCLDGEMPLTLQALALFCLVNRCREKLVSGDVGGESAEELRPFLMDSCSLQSEMVHVAVLLLSFLLVSITKCLCPSKFLHADSSQASEAVL